MYQYWIRLKRRRRNNQKGFTLIELLVVISILGILAAVVTMSMVGITKLAQDRAAATETQTVQLAVDSMASENNVAEGAVCEVAPANATSDMSSFPTGLGSDKISPPLGKAVALYPRYLRQQKTHGTYSCSNGQVKMETFTP